MRKPTLCLTALFLVSISLLYPLPVAAHPQKDPPSVAAPSVGGMRAIVLRLRGTHDTMRPSFRSVTLLPGRGMNAFQITAYLPGRGTVHLLASPPLAEAGKILNGHGVDQDGNESFMLGGAFLFPFANRILGPMSADGKYVLATWHGRTIRIHANWRNTGRDAAAQALHGQLLMAKASQLKIIHDGGSTAAIAAYVLPGEGNWFSSNRVVIRADLHPYSLTFSLIATNIGRDEEPVGIGWHPYFRVSANSLKDVRLHVPATMRLGVSNPEAMIPTGAFLPVKGTSFDFTAPSGAALTVPVNDAFVNLQRDARGYVVSRITDPKENLGLQVSALTPLVKTILIYAPLTQPLIVLEPQFNNGDPFGNEWRGKDNGMVTVPPGGTVTWRVRLTLFMPRKN